MENLKFDLNDIVIIPAESSDIDSRKECEVTRFMGWDFMAGVPWGDAPEFRMLPLMAAPMDTVVSFQNFSNFVENGIIPCVPRGKYINFASKKYFSPYFQSFGLCEIETQLKQYKETEKYWLGDSEKFYSHSYILIDIANGHMSKLIDLIKDIREIWKEVPQIMIGNVANPETFANLALAGADYVRCSIGTGAGCTTAANVGVNYPLGSLISECSKIKKELGVKTKIVADGGMRNYSDVIKALALGADYVMIGSTFNKAIESAGFNYLYGIKIPQKSAETLWRWGFPVKKKYRGMSTKAVQRSWGKSELVTAEGITKYQKVEYTLEQWTENFKDYLRSAMSYSNAKKLDDFIGVAQYVFITDAARRRFDK